MRRFRPTPPRRGRPSSDPRPASTDGSFDPRPRAGGDVCKAVSRAFSAGFRPTPPRRGRHHQRGVPWLIMFVSTHAPAQGATRTRWTMRRGGPVSTHAPAQGATMGVMAQDVARVFRPTPPRRGRRTPLYRAVFPPQSRLVLRSKRDPPRQAATPCRGVGICTTISNSRPGCEACREWWHAWGSQAGGARGSAGRSGRWRAWRRHARPGGTSSRPGSNSAGCPARGG